MSVGVNKAKKQITMMHYSTYFRGSSNLTVAAEWKTMWIFDTSMSSSDWLMPKAGSHISPGMACSLRWKVGCSWRTLSKSCKHTPQRLTFFFKLLVLLFTFRSFLFLKVQFYNFSSSEKSDIGSPAMRRQTMLIYTSNWWDCWGCWGCLITSSPS